MEDKKTKVSTWSKMKKSKKTPILLGVGFLAVLALVFIAIFTFSKIDTGSQEKGEVVFTIDGEDYFRNEMLNFASYNIDILGVSDDNALSMAYELEKELAAVKTLGLTPSDNDIQTEKDRYATDDIKTLEGYLEKYDQWFNTLARVEAAKRYVGGEFSPMPRGYLYVLAYRSEDESYAENKAQEFRQRIENASISPESALDEIKNDPKINPGDSIISRFGKDPIKLWDEEITNPLIHDTVKNMNNTGVSEVKKGETGSGMPERYFYFVYMDEVASSKVVSHEEYNSVIKSLASSTNGFTLSSENTGFVEKTRRN